MTQEILSRNQQLAGNLFAVLNSRDFTGLEDGVSDQVVLDFPGAGRVEGFRRVVIFMKALLRRYPRLVFTVSEVFSTESRACVIWTNEGIRLDGSPYVNSGLTLFHFDQGKIVFISDYFKDTSFTTEL